MSINGWMGKEDVECIHTGLILSHWKEWNNAVCSRMDLEIIILSEVSQRKANTVLHHLYVGSYKSGKNEFFLQTAIESQDMQGLIPRLGRYPGGRHGNWLAMDNPMDRGAWWARVHGVAKSRIWLSDWEQHLGLQKILSVFFCTHQRNGSTIHRSS